MSVQHSFFNRYQIVKQIPIFSKLNWFNIQRIARKAIIVEKNKGDIICEQGAPPDYFYCLVSGRIQAYSPMPDGTKENIEFIHRGTHFGVVSILTGEGHSLSFQAINNSVILLIPKNDFQEILQSIPALGVDLSQSLSQRIHKRHHSKKGVFESTIISVYSPVKRTGSTTYSINLGINLARETQKRVVLVHIHPIERKDETKAPTSPKWQIQPVNLIDIVEDEAKMSANIRRDDLEIHVLNVCFDSKDPNVLKQISPFVSNLVGDYHYVVVDLPSDMEDAVAEVLAQSDLVHLLTHDRKADLTLIRHVIDTLEEKMKNNFNAERIKVIIRAIRAKIYLSFEEIDRFIDFSVYKMLPFVPVQDAQKKTQSSMITFYAPKDEQSDYSKTIRSISREIGKVLVGISLGGGAALGIAHIGVIRVLEDENIPIDMIIGSSMGALVGALWAVGKDSHELEKVAAEFKSKLNMLKLFDPVIPISGLIGGHLIKRWLRKHLGNKTFYGCQIPFKVTSYDLLRREDLVLNSGTLVNAVRESIAIPGVIEPVKRHGKVIIDGGVLNPLPTNVLAANGIKKIIAVNVLQSPEQISEGIDIREKVEQESFAVPFYKAPFKFMKLRFKKGIAGIFTPNISDIIVKTLQATEYVIAQQSAQQADVTIHPDLVGIEWFELDEYQELIKRGEEAARQALPQIKELLQA